MAQIWKQNEIVSNISSSNFLKKKPKNKNAVAAFDYNEKNEKALETETH